MSPTTSINSTEITSKYYNASLPSSSQAKGTKSTSFLTCVRNEVDLV